MITTRRSKVRLLPPLLALVATAAGCTISACGAEDLRYIVRAAYEEARILARREPIQKILETEPPGQRREKLELALATRAFARDRLGLNVGGSYASLAEVEASQVVHVVSAAHRDRLEAYSWWFPIVGRVPYRGYFRPQSARDLAASLDSEGYDTYVRRALAFSTLGYFDDPLLSNLLEREPADLVETIIHEVLHSTIYIPGHAAFNESFANFVGHRGAIEFFAMRAEPESSARALARWDDALQFARLLTEILNDLEAAYEGGVSERQRSDLFDAAQQKYRDGSWQTNDYGRFAEIPLNNAVLLARRVYFDRLPLFDLVFTRFDGDLTRSIDWISKAAKSSDDDPYTSIEKLLSP